MAFSSLLGSTNPSPLLQPSNQPISSPSLPTRSQVKFPSTVLGATIFGESSFVQKSHACRVHSIKVTDTQAPPAVPKSGTSGKTRVGINGLKNANQRNNPSS